jgi:sugar lactone lactonase YvrE
MLGSMMHEGQPESANGGALHCITVDDNNQLTVSLCLDDVTIANGMGWTRDNKTM